MSLLDYEQRFRDLNPNTNAGRPSPHKVCLLLAVMDLVESGHILTNRIGFDAQLKNVFSHHFEVLKQGNDKDNPYQPFFHLHSQGFWQHKVREPFETEYQEMVSNHNARGPRVVERVIRYATLDDELFGHLQSPIARQVLRTALGENLGYEVRDALLNPKNGWGWRECELIVADYFQMLRSELEGSRYSKAAYRRLLKTQIERSEGSIEFKHCNISALLKDMGLPTIDGYKPRSNYQQTILPDVVNSLLLADKQLEGILRGSLEHVNELPDLVDLLGREVKPPDRSEDAEAVKESPANAFVPRKYDYVERNQRNQTLGDAGERFILSCEQEKLRSLGKDILADRVEKISDNDDTAGFDIKSYEANGRDRLIEVKTTSYSQHTRFYVTPNELAVSKKYEDRYHLYRVFNFNINPQFYVASGDIRANFDLRPNSYVAIR